MLLFLLLYEYCYYFIINILNCRLYISFWDLLEKENVHLNGFVPVYINIPNYYLIVIILYISIYISLSIYLSIYLKHLIILY